MSGAEGARAFYKQVLSPNNVVDNWEFLLEHVISTEVGLTIGTRLRRGNVLELHREIVSSVIAAELFPDRNPPEMLIAESESETHDDLRKRHKEAYPDTEPRISGDIVTELRGKKFFKMDGIMVSVGATTFFGVKSELGDVVEILLDMGLVPIDAECKMVKL